MSNPGKNFVVYTDGSAKPNPGPCGCGAVMLNDQGAVVWRLSEFLGEGTNNMGEFTAILRACTRARELDATALTVFSDSEFCVNLMNGAKDTKRDEFLYIRDRIRKFEKVMQVTYQWVKAHNGNIWNELADELANAAVSPSVTPVATLARTPVAIPAAPASKFSARPQTPPENALMLECPFGNKDEVKSLGARWNASAKKWWVEDTLENRTKFKKWIK